MEVPAAIKQESLRQLPSVDALAARANGLVHRLAVSAARLVIDDLRCRLLNGEVIDLSNSTLDELLLARAQDLSGPSLRPLINATGVVLHTNLGRAPLAPAAVEAVAAVAASYSNLEYDLESGGRGGRGQHVEPLLRELSGAEAALAVNNNAAAVLLALAALAGGGEVLIGRGQLIEIGGSFRIPDILAQSGAALVEIGTTNRTRLADYEAAIGERTAAILHVHQSNFRMVGFTEQPDPTALCRLAAERGIATIDDLGSGALEEVHGEPTLRGAVAAGADLVCCSADKLLGGPQAGILVGRAEAVERCRRHPLARALRLDKLQIAALEATLRLHRDEGAAALPVLAMIDAPQEELERRAEAMAATIGAAAEMRVEAGTPGGGALPELELEGPVCSVDPDEVGAERLAARLREAEPPVIGRIARGRLMLDPRTMSDEEAGLAAAAVRDALG